VIARLGRQLFGSVISAFALLGFVFVPLGERTGLEHAKAILATPEASRAGKGLLTQLEAVKRQFFSPNSKPETTPAKHTQREVANLKWVPVHPTAESPKTHPNPPATSFAHAGASGR